MPLGLQFGTFWISLVMVFFQQVAEVLGYNYLRLKNLRIFFWLEERSVFDQVRTAGKQIKEKLDIRSGSDGLAASDLASCLLMGNDYQSQGITYKILHCSNLKAEYLLY